MRSKGWEIGKLSPYFPETSIDSQEIVLIKPFSIAELSRALHSQLDA